MYQEQEEVYFHGEVLIKKIKGEIPKDAKKIMPGNGAYKVADSETTGNHHLLEAIEGVDVFEKDGMFYVRPAVNMKVRCVDEKRHDTITLEPCGPDEIFVFDRQQEVDHLTDEIRAIHD